MKGRGFERSERVPGGSLRESVGSAIVSVSLTEYSGIFGAAPAPAPLAAPEPAVRFVEWPWGRPLPVLLRVSGWTIHHVVSRPEVASEVRRLWKVWNVARRASLERERRNREAELRWWRRQGCPVPCPVCGAETGCGCSS